MTYKLLTVIAFFYASLAFAPKPSATTSNLATSKNLPSKNSVLSVEEKIDIRYTEFVENNTSVPSEESFRNGMIGYYKLLGKNKVKKKILTIIDFSLSSTKKRMWVLDMENNKVLFNNLVAHGQKTGVEFASKFSNAQNSHESSLGFFLTGETYYGKNGLSLFIDGLEKRFNSNARKRYVVIHGADYATESFVKKVGRLGRSYGCPAVPANISKELINTIKNKSVVYVYSKDENYNRHSAMIKA
ncbi:MAG: murein L,D-transpeptidase catalytic domain family protein [Gillisia sp.]